jgi:hypothetical protein
MKIDRPLALGARAIQMMLLTLEVKIQVGQARCQATASSKDLALGELTRLRAANLSSSDIFVIGYTSRVSKYRYRSEKRF